MKFLLSVLVWSIISVVSVSAAETNIFFPVYPAEAQSGQVPAQPVTPPSGGGGEWIISPPVLIISGFVFPTTTVSTWPVITIDIVAPTKTIIGTTNDILDAYNRAKQYNIASQPVFDEETIYTALTRVELARMMVMFSAYTDKGVLDNTPCKAVPYKDTAELSEEDLGFIVQACELGMMGRKAGRKELLESFNPEGKVTRAEFATVLSRFMYGDKYKNTTSPESRYVGHLLALHDKWFLHKIDEPFMQERQGYVMIVLQRIAASLQSL